mgnify:CR=1 FL=1
MGYYLVKYDGTNFYWGSKQTQIAKKEPTQTQLVAKKKEKKKTKQAAKQATTTFKPIKKIFQLKKASKKEKKTIVNELSEIFKNSEKILSGKFNYENLISRIFGTL